MYERASEQFYAKVEYKRPELEVDYRLSKS